MSQYPVINAGSRVLATTLTAMEPLIGFKSQDQQLVSSTVLANDNDLVVPLAGTGTYIIDCWLMFTATGGVDIKVAWTIPTSATMFWAAAGTGSANFTDNDESAVAATTARAARGNGTTPQCMPSKGYVTTTGPVGNLQLQWAQNTSNAAVTTMKAGSWIRATQIA